MTHHALTRRRAGLIAALANPVNLVIAGLLLVPALFSGGLWLLALALCIYAALVAWQTYRVPPWERLLDGGLMLPRLADPSDLSDSGLRALATSIALGYERVAQVFVRAPQSLQGQIDPTLRFLQELSLCSARLLSWGDELNLYLLGVRREGVQQEIGRLTNMLRCVDDESVQRSYQAALAQRREQLGSIDEIERAYAQVTASLTCVCAAVEALPARLMRLWVLETQAREDLFGALNEELAALGGELATSEQALRQLAPAATSEDQIVAYSGA